MLVFQEKTIPNMPGLLFLFKTTRICASVKSDLLDEKNKTSCQPLLTVMNIMSSIILSRCQLSNVFRR